MKILLFAHLQDVAGCVELQRDFGPVDVPGFWRELITEFPALAEHRANIRLARNGEYVDLEAQFSEADEVALIPPVSGG